MLPACPLPLAAAAAAAAACCAQQNPDLPADVFTACLTTPIKVALRWFCSRSLLRHDGEDLVTWSNVAVLFISICSRSLLRHDGEQVVYTQDVVQR
jgi:hypothetical protein